MTKSPIVASLLIAALSFAAEAKTTASRTAAGDIVLANENASLTFGGGNDFQFKEFNMSGKNLLPANGSTTYPWQLTYRGPVGENPQLRPQWGVYRGTEITDRDGVPAVKATWDMVLDDTPRWPVTVTVALADDAAMPSFYIDASLPEDWVITDVEFPRITFKQIKGGKAIMPIAYGCEYNLSREGQLQTRYPSVTGSMQLMMMHDPAGNEGTVFFAPRDADGGNKVMRMKMEGDNVTFQQEVTANYDWSKGGKFSLPYAVEAGYNPAGWQQTALEWYRPWVLDTKWAAKNVRDRHIAPWVEHADMWLRPGDVDEATMAAVREALKYYGKGVGLHWYYWHNYPFDTHYPEYFPAKPDFKEMIAEAQQMGAHVTPYINGRLWDPATASYKAENAKEASCRKPDGTLYTEVYSSKVLNTVTCPASQLWQDKLHYLNRHILDSLGTDGVYMDQIGCAAAEPCYADNHGHGKGGGSWWPEAYRKVLTDMRESFYTPDQAMTTEENAEPYIDLFDMMLVVNSPHVSYMRMVPLFPLIYSDRCVYSGFTYVPWKINDGSLRYMTMKSLLWGSQLGWVEPKLLMNEANRNEALMLKNLAKFRKDNHDIFFGGRFMAEFTPGGDNPTFDVPNYQPTPVVMGAEWTDVKGKRFYIVANMSDTDRKVTLPDGKSIKVKAFDAAKKAI
ncbi:MAG: glycoside hydrolase [Muribaculaceae bacterium]|nr:glycoside hydrolase [Muribaculaceae bacterium]